MSTGLEELESHLGHGALDQRAMERIGRIRSQLPDGAGGEGGEMWRAVTITRDQYDQLKAGVLVDLAPRPYECWSRAPLAVRHLLRVRASQAAQQQDEDGVARMALMLRREVPDSLCVLDIERFYLQADAEHRRGKNWIDYAGKEQEVILRVPGSRVTIRPEDVARVWDARDPSIWNPEAGETFWNTYGEEDLVIEELVGVDDFGCFRVRAGRRIYPLYPESFGFVLGGETLELDDGLSM